MKIIVVDYEAGNLASVRTALLKCGAEPLITGDAAIVAKAERLVFPGVGAAGAAMKVLKQRGLDDALRGAAARGAPIFGICLGTQVILERSEEDGGTECVGMLRGEVRKFDSRIPEARKVPHMGWNAVDIVRSHPVLEGVPSGAEFYFVHSYYPAARDAETVIGMTEYGIRFASALTSKTVVATQFHPEKSGRYGLKLLENFLRWKP